MSMPNLISLFRLYSRLKRGGLIKNVHLEPCLSKVLCCSACHTGGRLIEIIPQATLVRSLKAIWREFKLHIYMHDKPE
jgi:hypothetical protein